MKGEIVGSGDFGIGGGVERAVRFADGAVILLEDEVEDLTDWALLDTSAIGNDGVIVGTGFRHGDGKYHGYLLRPLP